MSIEQNSIVTYSYVHKGLKIRSSLRQGILNNKLCLQQTARHMDDCSLTHQGSFDRSTTDYWALAVIFTYSMAS